MKYLFCPTSVALIGASGSREKWGHRILFNLITGGFKGRIYPVNPRESEVLGLPSFPRVTEIPENPDLAVITIPPSGMKQAIHDCILKNVKCTVVITSGFSEIGPVGKRLEDEFSRLAKDAGMALVGPNCVGVLNPHHNLFCHMMPVFPRKGSVALVGQSGSLLDMLASRISGRGMGVSRFVSVGNEAVLQVADYLEYLADDNDTSVILAYVEGFRDGRKFHEIARKATRKKPIILLKTGSTEVGARAGQSHTGALAGADSVVDAALRQAGIIRVENLDDMVDAGLVFINQPLPRSNRVGIISAGGGWGVMAADACTHAGLEVVSLDDATLSRLNNILPDTWSHNNPVDTIAGVKGTVVELLETLLDSPKIDGVIVLGAIAGAASMWKTLGGATNKDDITSKYTQGAMDFLGTSFLDIVRLKDQYRKPILMSMFMPVYLGTIMDNARKLAFDTGVACYLSPAQAINAYAALSKYGSFFRHNR
ncbi:MAG: CoA-binding protein [Dehalococcoidia bacterium]|nr:CoA-binding protein [Dehalococcoidia bacterium]MDD5494304.1 CoA-binding protein [Dehalococcoidia bacterium]